jgi:quercetin dioxygenase-like cupin family protein
VTDIETMTSHFFTPSDLCERHLAAGFDTGLAWGEKIMLSRVRIAPDGVIPRHSHPHEQAGVCLSGEFELEVDGEARRIRPGDMWIIPGGTMHSARGVGVPAVALDVFTPLREDYLPPDRRTWDA